jgi:hypothetical protein
MPVNARTRRILRSAMASRSAADALATRLDAGTSGTALNTAVTRRLAFILGSRITAAQVATPFVAGAAVANRTKAPLGIAVSNRRAAALVVTDLDAVS